MKKLFLLVFCIFCTIFSFHGNLVSYADNESYRVCVNSASVFLEPSLSSEKIETLYYNDIILISDEEFFDSNVKFFKIIREEQTYGYVIASTVKKNENINYLIQPNAKLNADAIVYNFVDDKYEPIVFNDSEITLESGNEIKLLEKYNVSKKYLEIAFSYEDEILTGYVETEHISVSGFNYYFLIAIFLIVIVGLTVIPIIYKNWKKQRKANKNN